ncbi:hypothetical protein WJX72_004099 [[Myrmecia] bisecta]|uniref:BZIP domain-containing protein n=1 Tax=[Myrmecia] bisecta TaxID=41462 RepID=A0AAW1Q1Z7_9CHLO
MVLQTGQFQQNTQQPQLDLSPADLLSLENSLLDHYLGGLSESQRGGEVASRMPLLVDQHKDLVAAPVGSDSNSSGWHASAASPGSPASPGARGRPAGHEAEQKAAPSSEDGSEDAAEELFAARKADKSKPGSKASKQQRTLELQEKNRKAQRRFRERQKNKVLELEGMVAELQAKVQELTDTKSGLESRVNILVRVLQMRDEQIEHMRAKQQSQVMKDEVDITEIFKDNLTLTVREDQALTLTPEQVKAMTRTDLVLIWKEYVKQLAICLAEVEETPESPALERIKQLTNESTILVMRTGICNPVMSKSFVASQLEGMRATEDEENPDMWLPVARSLNLSPQQREDLGQLRRLFLQKMAAIVAARGEIHGELLAAMPKTVGSRHTALQFLKAHDSIDRLKRNLREEHVLKLDWISTVFKHMLTPVQVARCMVQAYPWCPDTLAICSWVAAEDGDASAIPSIKASPSDRVLSSLPQPSMLSGSSAMDTYPMQDMAGLPAGFMSLGLPTEPIPGSPPPITDDGPLMDGMDPNLASIPMLLAGFESSAMSSDSGPTMMPPMSCSLPFQQTVTTGLVL